MPSPRTITLGDYRINRIGLGTNRLTDTAENRDFLRRAVEAGVDLIDTAHLYTGGASERAVGAALSPFPPVDRKQAGRPPSTCTGSRLERAATSSGCTVASTRR